VPYLFCVVLPPLAVLRSRDLTQALLNLMLTCCLWVPGVVHALLLVKSTRKERSKQLNRALDELASLAPRDREQGGSAYEMVVG
jgi:uncharacterized membrane protein YqaE (UPF0057 family)